MKRLALYLGFVLVLAGCALFPPLTPEQREAQAIRSHCSEVGRAERAKFAAQVAQSTEFITPGGVYGGAYKASQESTVEGAAYRECMYRYGYRP